MAELYRVLLIGGYGFFGSRLAQRLALDPLLEVLIAGRQGAAATALAARLQQGRGEPRFGALAIDIRHPQLAEQIRHSRAQLVIHAGGPFQDQDYGVAKACIEAGVHYVDLADGRDFVCGIRRLDQAAKEADVLVCSGASSVPALSCAVVDAMAPDFAAIHSIDMGISPGNRTQRGLATVQGVLSYCGKRLQLWRDQRWQMLTGWQDMQRQDYPAPVGKRWLALCDVPDLALFPERYAGLHEVSFRAGTELFFMQWALWLMAGLRRAGLVRDWSRHAALLQSLSERLMMLGSDAGAMHVELSGTAHDGSDLRRRWTLVAENGDGPYVPTLASAILAGKFARQALPQRGAMPCLGLLKLEEFSAALSGLDIRTMMSETESRR